MMQYIVVAFVDEFEEDHDFIEWPLHVTLVTWFDVDDIDGAVISIAERIGKIAPIVTTVREERIWGPNTVNVIDKIDGLIVLHEKLLSVVKEKGRLLTNEQYMGENYTPHVTHQRQLALQPGDSLTIDKLYIIKKDANQRLKTIHSKMKLV